MENALTGACIIGQSGGPSAAINASAYGAIRAALDSPCITRVLGAEYGIRGVLDERLFDMALEDDYELSLLKYTPSSELGSVRYKLKDPAVDDTDYRRILEVFRKYDVRYFFYNGGNDSMDTCAKISSFMERSGWECRVMGIPKTIDNDLWGTDHCPGFGSAARYIATSCMELCKDARVYATGQVVVVEIMGRNAGWLAGSAALASYLGSGPDLVYLPEKPFSLEDFLEDVTRIYKETGNCVVAVSEGIRYSDGTFVSADFAGGVDVFGHVQLGGLAVRLAQYIREVLDTKVRGIELSLLQRCAAHLASETDLSESEMAGRVAVQEAVRGSTGMMVAFERVDVDGKYHCSPKLVPLSGAANFERKVPLGWINERGNGVEPQFIEYALPLIQGEPAHPTELSMPRYSRLKKIIAKP